MSGFIKRSLLIRAVVGSVRLRSDRPGKGAGKGGGGGGALREAGGAFGEMSAAREDEYFYNKGKAQLKQLKGDLSEEIAEHEAEIQRHKDAIEFHERKIKDMEEGKK